MTLGPQTVQVPSLFQGHFLHLIAWELTISWLQWPKAGGPESPVLHAVSGPLLVLPERWPSPHLVKEGEVGVDLGDKEPVTEPGRTAFMPLPSGVRVGSDSWDRDWARVDAAEDHCLDAG